jgi:signal transduction histidine kinase/DNA-binding response OmpR family regulator/sugar lactone lactonase YvrE
MRLSPAQRGRRWWVVALLLTLVARSGLANDWNQDAFQLRSWGINEGLPGNHVSAIAQDHDGFLWLATMAGLVRFDGVDFRVYNERNGQLPTGRFTALDVGPSGRLWIGSEQGHLILHENDQFRVVVPPRFPGIHVTSISESNDGSVWFVQGANPLGVSHTTLQHWTDSGSTLREDVDARLIPYPLARSYTTLDNPGGPITLENRFPQIILARDGKDEVWARAWAGSSLNVHSGRNDPFGAGDSTALMLGSAELMARRQDDRIDLLDLENGQRVASLPHDHEGLRGVWLRDQRDLVWVTEPTTLHVHGPDRLDPLASWPMDSLVMDLEEDREGNIWIATRKQGLIRIAPSPVQQLGPEQSLPLPSVLFEQADGSALMSAHILQPDGIENAREYLYRFLPGRDLPVLEPEYWQKTDRQGTEWHYTTIELRGTRSDGSQAYLDRSGAELYLDPLEDDVLWIKALTELLRVRTFPDRDPEVEQAWQMSIRSQPDFDADGGLWVGSTKGLHHISGEQYRRYDRYDGLPINEVRALYRDDRDGLWIGTYGAGLVHFDGDRFLTIDQQQGLQENFISSIVPDRHGALWLGGNRGIQRVLIDDLYWILANPGGAIPTRLYGPAHGLANPEANGPNSAVAVGDRLLFATFGGVAAVDPGLEAQRESIDPLVHILDPSTGSPITDDWRLTLSEGARRLQLDLTALHLSAPDTLRFRHRLEGYDADWVATGSRRQLVYDPLPPGQYSLRVQARHSARNWVDAGEAIRVEVLPLWWETTTARITAAALFLMLLVAAWLMANRHLRQRAQALAALVDERTKDLQVERDQVQRQATRLQELAEGRARFMSGISHELRTPLSLILAPLQDLGEGRHGNLSDEVETRVSGAYRNARRLMRLVERLLEVARIEAGVQSLHCQKIDLRAAIEELAEQLQPLAAQRRSRLIVALPIEPVFVWVDLLLMESVLVNLIVNGLRHTPPDSEVRVELESPDAADPQIIRLQVRDDGPGIPEDALPHLFERFFRVSGEQASGSDGFGLGLPLVREVIERHGGRIQVTSSAEGSYFSVELLSGRAHLSDADLAPVAPGGRRQAGLLSGLPESLEPSRQETRPDTAEPSPARQIPDQDSKLVLVIDDNVELRELLRRYLEPQFRIIEAEDGAVGLELARQQLPDLIVTDIMMPVMDGLELCRRLRADSDTSFLPILMLTARAGLEHRIEGLEGGSDAYLGKPFERRELLATVGALLAGQQRLKSHYVNAQARVISHAPSSPIGQEVATSRRPETQASSFANKLLPLIARRLPDENLDIEGLAESMAMDRSSLYRKVKSEFGMSPSELLRDTRLERALDMLQRAEGNVSEVAYAVGFRTVAYFSTSFRQRFGYPPSAVKKQGLSQPESP